MTSTTAQIRAEKKRRRLVEQALDKWGKWAKKNGLSHTSVKSGAREIERATRPGVTANRMIREFSGREVCHGKKSVTVQADQSDVLELRVKLCRHRGGAWFPSDPQHRRLGELSRGAADRLTVTDFKQVARSIAAMPRPYSRAVLVKETASPPYVASELATFRAGNALKQRQVIEAKAKSGDRASARSPARTNQQAAGRPPRPAVRMAPRRALSNDPFPPEWLEIPDFLERRASALPASRRDDRGLAVPSTMAA